MAMSKQQLKQLETILFKLESLQHSVSNETIKDRLGIAKLELLVAHRKACER
jgi:hypothetical protein